MSVAAGSFTHPEAPGPRAAFGVRPGPVLAGTLATGAAACALLAWRIEPILARYDTLAYLLEGAHGVEMTRIRLVLGAVVLVLAGLSTLALIRWRAANALAGWSLLVAGLAAGPLVRGYLAPGADLAESLRYRLRGFSAVGVLGGSFLIFLSLIPALVQHAPGTLETVLARRIRRVARTLQAMPPLGLRVGIGLLAIMVATGVGLLVLQNFPNSSDENSYLTQAHVFATGRLWLAAPSHPEFFRARSFIMDEEHGRFFAKAFPGWAAILSCGVKAGVPWMINPLLSALALVLAGWIGGRFWGRTGELAVVGMILATPFFLFNAASYYNHPATLLLITLFLIAVLRLSEGAGSGWAFLAGLAGSLALWIRPVSAAALTVPLGVWLAARWVREGRWSSLGAALAPLIAALGGIAVYNRRMFGSIWVTGYGAYDRADIQPGMGIDHLAITAWWLLKLCLWLIPGSLAGLWFLLHGRRWRSWFRQEPILALMLVSLAVLLVSYLLLQNKGGNEYGPRYYYDGIAYLAILLVAGWRRAPVVLQQVIGGQRFARGASLALAFGVVLTLAGTMPFLMFHYRDKIMHNRDLFASVERSGLSSGLIFLATGSGRMPPGDLLRNPPDFRSGVVYARDLGPEADRELATLYSDRPALVYRYDPVNRTSTLRPLDTEAPK